MSPRLQGRYRAFAWEDVTVVATGVRARELSAILSDAGWRPSTKPSAPRLDRLPAEFAESIMRVYHDVGGVQEYPWLAPGSWDLAYSDLLVELDESFHFNRYRESTLGTPWAASLPWVDVYLEHCKRWERFAGTGGKRWSNDSAKRMFGGADPEGEFDAYGAPRWKQRALYDAMKDAAAASGQVNLARVSIYDQVEGIRLDDVLYRRAHLPADRVAEFVLSRAAVSGASTADSLEV
jgi:hypothetical protein